MLLYRKTFAPGKHTFSGNLAAPAKGSQNNYFILIKEETGPAEMVADINLVDQPTKEFKKLPSVNVYPNPKELGKKVTLEIGNVGQKEKVLVTLHDLTGHTVLTQSILTNEQGELKTEVPLSENVKSGIYLLQIQTSSGKQQVKLLIP